MNRWRSCCLAFAVLLVGVVMAKAQEQGVVRPQVLLREIVQGMPKAEKQEVRVLQVSFQPGDRTLFHTHRFPVTVYVLEGVFTMEMPGRETITVNAGGDDAATREHDWLQPEQLRPLAVGGLLRERTGHTVS